RQTRLNRFVALKVLLAGSNAGPKALARFRSEAIAVAQAQHPYIVQILDTIEQNGQVCLALEYVGGGSLAGRIASRPLPIHEAAGRVRDVGPAADVYSLGTILYEMLTGLPPFRGEALVQVLDAVRFKKPKPPREWRPEVPRDLETVCLKCLEKNPAKRYRTAG